MTPTAWFWTFDPPCLWIGYSGVQYVGAREIEPCKAMDYQTACEVFCRQVAPYAAQLILPGKITIFRFNQIY